MSLKSVKNKIKSIDKTRQVTKAMEAVSAVKMRKSQSVALNTRPYALAAFKIFRSITRGVDVLTHPLMEQKDTHRVFLIVISGDKGLAGNYGSALLKGVYAFMKKQSLKKDDVDLIVVGKKAREHFAKRHYKIIAHYEHWSDGVSFDDVRPIATMVKNAFLTGSYGHVYIVYTHFLSTLKQKVVERQLLPVNPVAVEDVIRGIIPTEGKYRELDATTSGETTPDSGVFFEPSADVIMNDLVPELFNIQIYHSILEANASEHSARMIAMKNASDNAGEISRSLKLHFNKVRQSAITREVSEIVGGMESMRVVDQ